MRSKVYDGLMKSGTAEMVEGQEAFDRFRDAVKKILSEFSIAWRDLPDAEKCRCGKPMYPEGPLAALLRRLARAWRD